VRASATGAFIHDNRIHDCLPGASVGIMVGTSTADSSKRVGARIVNNTCTNLRAGSSETLSFKSSGNVMSGNRLINCNNITNRHGEGNQIIGNQLQGSKSIVVHDARTLVANNVASIQIMAGNVAWNTLIQGKHPQAYQTVLRGNSGSLTIGRAFSGHNYPALNTRVEGHRGRISLTSKQQGTILP
jgi:hypothetical protein